MGIKHTKTTQKPQQLCVVDIMRSLYDDHNNTCIFWIEYNGSVVCLAAMFVSRHCELE